MRLLGVDIDGTLLPLKGKKDNLESVRHQLRSELDAGTQVVLLTSRADSRAAQREVRLQHGLNLDCVGFSRDWPIMKGQYLQVLMERHPRITQLEFWDDEDWYLNPASKLGIQCVKVANGELNSHVCPAHYIPWVPVTPCPAVRIHAKA